MSQSQVGHACIDLNAENVSRWKGTLPARIEYWDGNNMVLRADVDKEGNFGGHYKIVPYFEVDAPDPRAARGDATESYDGTNLVVDPHWIAASKTTLKAYASEKCQTILAGGLTIGPYLVPTDIGTLVKVMGAFLQAKENAELNLKWKLVDGTYITLTGAQVINNAATIFQFIQSTLAKEATAIAAIDAETITTTAQVDTAFV